MNVTDCFSGLFYKYVPLGPQVPMEIHEGFFQPLKIQGEPWGIAMVPMVFPP